MVINLAPSLLVEVGINFILLHTILSQGTTCWTWGGGGGGGGGDLNQGGAVAKLHMRSMAMTKPHPLSLAVLLYKCN